MTTIPFFISSPHEKARLVSAHLSSSLPAWLIYPTPSHPSLRDPFSLIPPLSPCPYLERNNSLSVFRTTFLILDLLSTPSSFRLKQSISRPDKQLSESERRGWRGVKTNSFPQTLPNVVFHSYTTEEKKRKRPCKDRVVENTIGNALSGQT